MSCIKNYCKILNLKNIFLVQFRSIMILSFYVSDKFTFFPPRNEDIVG